MSSMSNENSNRFHLTEGVGYEDDHPSFFKRHQGKITAVLISSFFGAAVTTTVLLVSPPAYLTAILTALSGVVGATAASALLLGGIFASAAAGSAVAAIALMAGPGVYQLGRSLVNRLGRLFGKSSANDSPAEPAKGNGADQQGCCSNSRQQQKEEKHDRELEDSSKRDTEALARSPSQDRAFFDRYTTDKTPPQSSDEEECEPSRPGAAPSC